MILSAVDFTCVQLVSTRMRCAYKACAWVKPKCFSTTADFLEKKWNCLKLLPCSIYIEFDRNNWDQFSTNYGCFTSCVQNAHNLTIHVETTRTMKAPKLVTVDRYMTRALNPNNMPHCPSGKSSVIVTFLWSKNFHNKTD